MKPGTRCIWTKANQPTCTGHAYVSVYVVMAHRIPLPHSALAPTVNGERICAALEQHPHSVLVTSRRGAMQRQEPVVRLSVWIGAVQQEQVDHLALPPVRCGHQRRLPSAVAHLEIGTLLDEICHCFHVSTFGRIVQRRLSLHVGLVHVRGQLLNLEAPRTSSALPNCCVRLHTRCGITRKNSARAITCRCTARKSPRRAAAYTFPAICTGPPRLPKLHF